MTSRTDALRKGGARERAGTGGGGGIPFVKWGENYCFLEGRVESVWEGKYGLSATMHVTAVSLNPVVAVGKSEEGEEFRVGVEPGIKVNVGLNSATLNGKIVQEDEGKEFHIAFEGWEQAKGGNRYRIFTVIELTERGTAGPSDEPEPVDTRDYSEGDPDEGMPF